jgi:two-component system, cell cycle response regulator
MSVQASEGDSVPSGVRLAVQGLPDTDRQLLAGLVRLSERDTRNRALRLVLLAEADAQQADVLLIDAGNAAALAWARQQPWLAGKAVIWIDAASAPQGHIVTRRPVQWPVLPVLLTRALDQRPRATVAAPQPRPAGRMRPRVLVVDDSAMARAQVRSLLAQQGCDTVEAASVDDGLARLAQGSFDAVFMDVLMPGVDGYDGCRRIKARSRSGGDVPVAMLTSKSSPFDRIRGKMAGCDAYLAKPVDAPEIARVLAQLVPAAQVAMHPAAGLAAAQLSATGFAAANRPATAGAT